MLTPEIARLWLNHFAALIDDNKAHLSDLDTPIGDADHGNNMARGMVALTEALQAKPDLDLAGVFKASAMALISKVGGASGPLYGTAFLEMAKTAKNSADLPTLLDAALAGVIKRGGAEVGDKTMVDAWTPLVKATHDGTLSQAVIDEAVASTEPLVAKKGRAAYLGERGIGHRDPGAESTGYLFKALLETEGTL
ncbi:dihydroxyacetone kinase subunit DhaL [Lacticaseibacillus manihotivorans]|jgi:dihydroxyacetone kinase-like protein|uniref:phosphoenolpyruvate--glycerone phosphotransferase n=2 Tax=Lacticaseibacillus manihotivorans TaxID=88233 RepID=A0A0R1QTR2_9LACO|nr:dihydroxyacetone kinase subunit DhaL [Lacticaseibacillus manihotivorans]KRL44611.1 dihydroxyacetone kinase [Lacticaseibacillus manihotivorans DSM 13343 = JCM 12514]QFQ92346.1 dihydroxyacetone kinase subunit L [Lacticaseibacillus manihotivorans]